MKWINAGMTFLYAGMAAVCAHYAGNLWVIGDTDRSIFYAGLAGGWALVAAIWTWVVVSMVELGGRK